MNEFLKNALSAGALILVIFGCIGFLTLMGAFEETCHVEIIKEKVISGGMANDYLLVTNVRVWSVSGTLYARADVGDYLEVCSSMAGNTRYLVTDGGEV